MIAMQHRMVLGQGPQQSCEWNSRLTRGFGEKLQYGINGLQRLLDQRRIIIIMVRSSSYCDEDSIVRGWWWWSYYYFVVAPDCSRSLTTTFGAGSVSWGGTVHDDETAAAIITSSHATTRTRMEYTHPRSSRACSKVAFVLCNVSYRYVHTYCPVPVRFLGSLMMWKIFIGSFQDLRSFRERFEFWIFFGFSIFLLPGSF